MFGFSIGFGCIPFLLLGEIFPTQQRSLLSSLAGSFNLAVMFIVIKTYHPLEMFISTAGTFWMYSGLCAFGVFFVIMFVPETKGRDLESIAKLFQKKIKVKENKNVDIEKRGKVNGIGGINELENESVGTVDASSDQKEDTKL